MVLNAGFSLADRADGGARQTVAQLDDPLAVDATVVVFFVPSSVFYQEAHPFVY